MILLMKMPMVTIAISIVKNWLTLKTHKIRGENGDYYLQLYLKFPIKETTEIATVKNYNNDFC